MLCALTLRQGNETYAQDDGRQIIGGNGARLRHQPRLFYAVYCAARADGNGEAGHQARANAWGEGGRLYGRCLCPRQARARALHGAIGRRGQSGGRLAGCLALLLSGRRHHRARVAEQPIAPRLPRSGSLCAIFSCHQVQRLRRRSDRAFAACSAGFSRGDNRHAPTYAHRPARH